MATPLFFHIQLDDFNISHDNPNYHVYCVEKWSQNSTVEEGIERTYYTYFSMAMQYVVPFVIMASIYLKIFYYLKTYRLFWMGVIRDSSINQSKGKNMQHLCFVLVFSFCTSGKDWTFWEANMIWKKSSSWFWRLQSKTIRKIFSNFVCFSESPNFTEPITFLVARMLNGFVRNRFRLSHTISRWNSLIQITVLL